jgi:hypothetical protein
MSIKKENLLYNDKNIQITSLDDQIKKINKIISVIEKIKPENSVTHDKLDRVKFLNIPYNFNVHNLEKANTSDFKTLSNFTDKIRMIKDSINNLKLKNTNELLEIVNNNFKKYTEEIREVTITKIVNSVNIYDNIIITYLLALLISIRISINILNELNKDIKLEDIIKNDNYLNMSNIKIININYVKKNNKIFFMNKFYLEVIIKNNRSIIFNITNNSNKIIEQIELDILDKKIIINDIKYEIKL